MGNYIYTGNELISESDVRHWKYVKREKRNGRWVYYYNDSEYSNSKKAYESAKKNKINQELRTYAREDQMRKAGKEYRKKYANSWGPSISKEHSRAFDKAANAQTAYIKQANKLAAAERKYEKTRKKYQKVSLKTLPRRTIATGAAKVMNILSKLHK